MVWKSIATSVSGIPEMLKGMKVMVGQAHTAYARQTGLAVGSSEKLADTWQNAVINAVTIRDVTLETAGAVKRIYGPEIAGSVSKLEASTQFIDAYWENIYNNAKLAEAVNESMGYEAVKASSGAASIMEHIQFSKRLLLDQTGMLGKTRVLQVMAKESIAKNNKQIAEIDDQYNALSNKMENSDKGREWMTRTEKEKMRARQDELTGQKKALEQDNFRIESNRQLLSIFNKITGAVQNTAAAFGVGVEANDKRLDLAEKT